MTTDINQFKRKMKKLAQEQAGNKNFNKFFTYHQKKLIEMKRAMNHLRWLQHIEPYLYKNFDKLENHKRSFKTIYSYNLMEINRSIEDGEKAFEALLDINYSPPKNIDDLILHGTVIYEFDNATYALPLSLVDLKIDLSLFKLTLVMNLMIARMKFKKEANPRKKMLPMILKQITERKPKEQLVKKIFEENQELFIGMAYDPMCEKIREIFESRHNEGNSEYSSVRPPSKSTIKRYLRPKTIG